MAVLLILILLPVAFTTWYLWKGDMWLGLVGSLSWFGVAIFYMTQSEATNPLDTGNGDIWLVVFWICMMATIALAFATYRWRDKNAEWIEDNDEETGEPIMVMLKKGMRTSRERPLTDAEIVARDQRIKEEREARERPRRDSAGGSSSFSQTGKMP